MSGPMIYTLVAGAVGVTLIATGEMVGSFIPMPSGRIVLGLLILLSIPFVWLGALLS